MPAPDDPHEVLGVPRSASPEEVTRAYRAAARRTHPDSPDGDAAAFAAATAAYARIRRDRLRRDPPGRDRPRRGVPIPVRRAGGRPEAVLRVRWPDAVLGARLSVRVQEQHLEVDLPPGSRPGTVLRVSTPDGGVLSLTVEVDVPSLLSDDERAAVERLAGVLGPPVPR